MPGFLGKTFRRDMFTPVDEINQVKWLRREPHDGARSVKLPRVLNSST